MIDLLRFASIEQETVMPKSAEKGGDQAMRSAAIAIVFVAVAAILALPAICSAAGGLYVDDFQVTNNGTVIFRDDFESGKLTKWSKPTHDDECVVACQKPDPSPQGCALYLNRHRNSAAGVGTGLRIEQCGDLEMSARFWLLPVNEQYQAKGTAVAGIQVWSSSCALASYHCYIHLNPKDSTYQIQVEVQAANRKQVIGYADNVTLAPNKWATIKLRADTKAEKICAYLNDKLVLTEPYNPAEFASIASITLNCGFGDGALITDEEKNQEPYVAEISE